MPSQTQPSPTSKGPPRLDPYKRLLARFYESLKVAQALNHKSLGHRHTAHHDSVSMVDTQRRLLNNLAYLCDNEKGGDSTTAVAVEDRGEDYKFWVAINKHRRDPQNAAFLRDALGILKRVLVLPVERRYHGEVVFENYCIRFVAPRLKKEIFLLSREIKKCQQQIKAINDPVYDKLSAWLSQFESRHNGKEKMNRSPMSWCSLAYDVRDDDYMHQMAELAKQDGNQPSPFKLARHHLARLAHRIRVFKQIYDDGARLRKLFSAFSVNLLQLPDSVPLQGTDRLTKLKPIFNRMMASDDPRRPMVDAAIEELPFDLEERILEQYGPDKNKAPTVHCEIQILEYFYKHDLKFANDDRYIGCSKASCLCCKLYIRHHPARCQEPETHNNLVPRWGPPLLPDGSKDPGYKPQRDLLNKILHDVRGLVLDRLITLAKPDKHPDSVSRLTSSTPEEGLDESLDDMYSSAEDSVNGRVDDMHSGEEAGPSEASTEVEYDSDSDGGVML